MLYEIVNPSDPYTLDYDDPAVAAAAVLILGRGQYAVTNLETGEDILPIFIFGGDPSEWFEETYGENLNNFIESNEFRIAECLDSVVYGRKNDRDKFLEKYNSLKTDEEKLAYRDEWQDQRSSVNNIGQDAYRIANTIRKNLDK